MKEEENYDDKIIQIKPQQTVLFILPITLSVNFNCPRSKFPYAHSVVVMMRRPTAIKRPLKAVRG